MLDWQVCDRARVARDARFDGRFFTGVVTTRVYCRPICPVRPARSENVRFFPSAASAERAGFRPCLRCRPELAPETSDPPTLALVARGVRLVNRGFLDEHRLADLAAELAIGERQLTRLFVKHLGTTPGAMARTRRTQLAKRLLDETGLTVTQIAFAAGFSSIRRFNAAFVATHGRSPAEMRRRSRSDDGQTPIVLRLPLRPPFDWDSLALLLQAEATPGVERVERAAYRRAILLGGRPGWIEVTPVPGAHHLRLRLHLSDYASVGGVLDRVRGIFDLGANPAQIHRQLARHPQVAQILGEMPGLRLPGAWDGLEVAVRALAVEDVGWGRARSTMRLLVLRHGQHLESAPNGWPDRVFPLASTLAGADVAACGLSTSAGERIRRLARAVGDGTLRFGLTGSFDDLVADLERIGGFDRPTSHWIAMRTLGEPDARPFGTRAIPGLDGPREAALAEHETWRPWRSYVAVALVAARLRASRHDRVLDSAT